VEYAENNQYSYGRIYPYIDASGVRSHQRLAD